MRCLWVSDGLEFRGGGGRKRPPPAWNKLQNNLPGIGLKHRIVVPTEEHIIQRPKSSSFSKNDIKTLLLRKGKAMSIKQKK